MSKKRLIKTDATKGWGGEFKTLTKMGGKKKFHDFKTQFLIKLSAKQLYLNTNL